ncbi:MAG: MerR family transcriptional regulator [Thomasclavelia sp.]|uniref:MerR family transcriptional regulator n=1 Tax=Thomasclavelia sp. TaxID=3025757 RepID=UPI0039A10C94
MLTIGEFSNICKVSTKTLRYYAEIGLILPEEINPENGYRYYSIEQLETMLFINRLKSYNFSLDEIKMILETEESQDEKLSLALTNKKKEMIRQVQLFQETLKQLNDDLSLLQQGKSIMSYLDTIEVELVEVPAMNILKTRKMVQEDEFETAYVECFGKLFRDITTNKLTVLMPPMVLFHSSEFTPLGLDTEFAIVVEETNIGTRKFAPGLCLKTTVYGSYSNLSSVYTKQREWAEKKGYENTDALYEVYVNDPTQVSDESELVTEVYYPVRKRTV